MVNLKYAIKPIKKGYGLNIGLGLGLVPYNINFDFEMPETYTFYHEEYYDRRIELEDAPYVNALYLFPISIQKSISKSHTTSYIIELGMKLNKTVFKEWVNYKIIHRIMTMTDPHCYKSRINHKQFL